MTKKSLLAIVLAGLLVVAIVGLGIATTSPIAPSAADDTTTSTTTVDPPTVPGAVIHPNSWTLSYAVADPTGALKPTTESAGGNKYQCLHWHAHLVSEIGVIDSSTVPSGYEITAVSPCTKDTHSFTTDTTTTTGAA